MTNYLASNDLTKRDFPSMAWPDVWNFPKTPLALPYSKTCMQRVTINWTCLGCDSVLYHLEYKLIWLSAYISLDSNGFFFAVELLMWFVSNQEFSPSQPHADTGGWFGGASCCTIIKY